jgi:hypothetical protein
MTNSEVIGAIIILVILFGLLLILVRSAIKDYIVTKKEKLKK